MFPITEQISFCSIKETAVQPVHQGECTTTMTQSLFKVITAWQNYLSHYYSSPFVYGPWSPSFNRIFFFALCHLHLCHQKVSICTAACWMLSRPCLIYQDGHFKQKYSSIITLHGLIANQLPTPHAKHLFSQLSMNLLLLVLCDEKWAVCVSRHFCINLKKGPCIINPVSCNCSVFSCL